MPRGSPFVSLGAGDALVDVDGDNDPAVALSDGVKLLKLVLDGLGVRRDPSVDSDLLQLGTRSVSARRQTLSAGRMTSMSRHALRLVFVILSVNSAGLVGLPLAWSSSPTTSP